MKVEIWSDVMCPFCYIGKRHFEAALETFQGKDEVEIEWKSFQLNPEMKHVPNLSVIQYLAQAKGVSIQESEAMHDRVVGMAKNAGLDFHFEKAVVANSFKAHRVLQLAKEKGLGDQLKELFLKGYFSEGMNMENAEELAARAFKVGLTEEDVHNALNDPRYEDKVKEDLSLAARFGVRGVPFFVFDRKYAVSGAQPVESFSQVLDKSFSEWRAENPAFEVVDKGDSCDIDNPNC